MRDIEIIGTSSVTKDLAPYKGEVWGLNHAFSHVRRFDKWFEVHKNTILNFDGKTRYQRFLMENQKKVYLCAPRNEDAKEFYNKVNTFLPDVNFLPIEDIQNLFGNYLKSSIDYLVAYAILEEVESIGFYGVDLADSIERWQQRRSLEHKIGFAQAKGIKINIPNESPLLKTSHMYGMEDIPFYYQYLLRKRLELHQRIIQTNSQEEKLILSGALDTVESTINNWM